VLVSKHAEQSYHKPLTYLFSMKTPTSKFTRMRLDLDDYQFTAQYLRENKNYVADAISRISIEQLKDLNRQILKLTIEAESM